MDVITTQVRSFHGRTVKDAVLTDSTVRGRFSQLGEPAAVVPATSSDEAILVSRWRKEESGSRHIERRFCEGCTECQWVSNPSIFPDGQELESERMRHRETEMVKAVGNNGPITLLDCAGFFFSPPFFYLLAISL